MNRLVTRPALPRSGRGLALLVALAAVGLAAIVAVAGGVTVWLWNTLLVDLLGARVIDSLGGAVLFLAGLWVLGRLAGAVLLCWAMALAATGGRAAILDLSLDASGLFVLACFLLALGGPRYFTRAARRARAQRR